MKKSIYRRRYKITIKRYKGNITITRKRRKVKNRRARSGGEKRGIGRGEDKEKPWIKEGKKGKEKKTSTWEMCHDRR